MKASLGSHQIKAHVRSLLISFSPTPTTFPPRANYAGYFRVWTSLGSSFAVQENPSGVSLSPSVLNAARLFVSTASGEAFSLALPCSCPEGLKIKEFFNHLSNASAAFGKEKRTKKLFTKLNRKRAKSLAVRSIHSFSQLLLLPSYSCLLLTEETRVWHRWDANWQYCPSCLQLSLSQFVWTDPTWKGCLHFHRKNLWDCLPHSIYCRIYDRNYCSVASAGFSIHIPMGYGALWWFQDHLYARTLLFSLYLGLSGKKRWVEAALKHSNVRVALVGLQSDSISKDSVLQRSRR